MIAVNNSIAKPRGFTALGLFFYFGGLMSSYAAVTLAKPGTALDALWALNKRAHVQLSALGGVMAIPFTVLAVVMFLSGYGWFRRRYWAWVLAVSSVATSCAGDLIRAALGDWFRSGVGVVIAGALFFYLTRPGVRGYFLLFDIEDAGR